MREMTKMSTYDDIRSSRRLVWAGIVLGYAVAAAVALINFRSEDGSVLSALAFLAMLSIPATMALYSLDRRPSLLTAAGMAALLQGFVLLSSAVGLLNVVVVILWYLGSQRRPRGAAKPKWATWVRPLLGLAAILPLFVMFIHLDPRCTSTDRQGNVSVVEAVGFTSGWRFFTSEGTTGSSSETSDNISTYCSSDVVQPWEAGVSIVLSIAMISLISRWPTTDSLDQVVQPGRPSAS